MLTRLSDHHDRLAAQMNPVNEHDLVHLIDHGSERPDLPQVLAPPPKRPPTPRHIRLTGPAEQPGKELAQVLGRRVNLIQTGDIAGRTPPPLPSS